MIFPVIVMFGYVFADRQLTEAPYSVYKIDFLFKGQMAIAALPEGIIRKVERQPTFDSCVDA